MNKVNLNKEILPGTWRYLGERCPNICPSIIPIAGNCYASIAKSIEGEVYKIGRFKLDNAFLVVRGRARFLYVRPNYSAYRKVAERVFSVVPWKVDYDHSLAKIIFRTSKNKYKYKYVLLLRVPPSVNRQHGAFEKRNTFIYKDKLPKLLFANKRIFDKWLGRPPKARSRSSNIMYEYNADANELNGLTLKQRGKWAYAIGMGDDDLTLEGLIEL